MEKSLVDHLFDLVDKLKDKGVKYTLIGGFAVIFYGANRTTGDIDLLVDKDKDNINRLREALLDIYHDKDIEEITSEELEKYSVIRYGTSFDFCIDIIGSLGETFNYWNIESVEKKIENHIITLATAKSLYDMKKNTYREIDMQDILFLKNHLREK